MKIGIVTLHRAFNMGAMLQALALQKTLSTMHDACIVDYRSYNIEKQYHRKYDVKGFIKAQVRWVLRHKNMLLARKLKSNFEIFEDTYLLKSSKHYTESNIVKANSVYDAFVSGSDQVWNLKCTYNDWNYYLQFALPQKRYSYAASFGNVEYNDEQKKKAYDCLDSFNNISIREKNGIAILNRIGIDSKRAEIVCDPTFFLDKSEWISMLDLKEEITEKYILVFIVAAPTHAIEYARKLARKSGYKIKYINVNDGYRLSYCPDGMENCNTSGPREFMQILLNAEYIVTTSFHGMALSTIMNKQFYYELDKVNVGINARLTNLAEILDLTGREIVSSEIMKEQKIDYDRVNPLMKEYADKSRKILFDSLKSKEK